MDRRNERARAWRAKQSQEYLQTRERKYTLRYNYGLTPEQYDTMFQVQGGVCAICKNPPQDDKKRRLVVDHCHATEKNRGLLCIKCNNTLERLESIPNWQERAYEYLAKYTSKETN